MAVLAGTYRKYSPSSMEQTYEACRDIMSTVAEVGTAICGTYYAAKGGNVCFVEGTPVQCEQGAVPIETVTAGILVWAWDLQKYSKGTQKVTFQRKSLTAHFVGKYYWLDDLAGHGTNGSFSFKVFRKTGKYLEWYADADLYGNFITGKHKGPTGLRLRLD